MPRHDFRSFDLAFFDNTQHSLSLNIDFLFRGAVAWYTRREIMVNNFL
jgi:hypothetical protein